MRNTHIGTILIIFSIIFVLAGIFFSNLSWVLLTSILMIFFSYAYLRFYFDLKTINLEINRSILEDIPFSGSPIPIKLEILNSGIRPIRADFEDIIPEEFEIFSGSNETQYSIPPQKRLVLDYSLITMKRGMHLIKGINIIIKDDFGIFLEKRIIEEKLYINVHAKKEIFKTARKLARKEYLDYSGIAKHIANVMHNFEFESIRDYMPGDRARDTHWKILGKLDKLMTKVFQKEGAIQTTILIDCSRSMRIKEKNISKLDHSIILTIQLSKILLSNFYSVGTLLVDESSIIDYIPSAYNRNQFLRITQLLLKVPNNFREEIRLREIISNLNHFSKENISNNLCRQQDNFTLNIQNSKFANSIKLIDIGLEAAIKRIITTRKQRKQLFIIITDLISSRDAVISSANICQKTNNKLVILHTFDDWYKALNNSINVSQAEYSYNNILNIIGIEKKLKELGATYIRIGPADLTSRLTKVIRRESI